MTPRIPPPTTCRCKPRLLALHAGQSWECDHGTSWRTIDAIDHGRGNDQWFAKWVIA